MNKLERMAAKEFHKLPLKEQKRINNLKRIPVPKPGYEFDKLAKPRKKHWNVEDDY